MKSLQIICLETSLMIWGNCSVENKKQTTELILSKFYKNYTQAQIEYKLEKISTSWYWPSQDSEITNGFHHLSADFLISKGSVRGPIFFYNERKIVFRISLAFLLQSYILFIGIKLMNDKKYIWTDISHVLNELTFSRRLNLTNHNLLEDPEFYSRRGLPVLTTDHGHLSPPKCLVSTLLIRPYACMLRLSRLSASILSASMHVWRPVLKPLRWGVRLSLQGLAALSKTGEKGECPQSRGWVPCNSNGLSGLQRRRRQWHRCPCSPLTTVHAAASVRRYTRHRDRKGKDRLPVQCGSLSRPCTPGERESALQTPAERNMNPPAAPTLALASLMGHLPEPPQGLSSFQRKIWQENHLHTRNKESSALWGRRAGSSIFTLEASVQPETGEPQRKTAQLGSTICERGDEKD